MAAVNIVKNTCAHHAYVACRLECTCRAIYTGRANGDDASSDDNDVDEDERDETRVSLDVVESSSSVSDSGSITLRSVDIITDVLCFMCCVAVVNETRHHVTHMCQNIAIRGKRTRHAYNLYNKHTNMQPKTDACNKRDIYRGINPHTPTKNKQTAHSHPHSVC